MALSPGGFNLTSPYGKNHEINVSIVLNCNVLAIFPLELEATKKEEELCF